ncbi:MAG TPA: O-antigen ligase family protein [Methylomusa anaerophila]|uniref:O-Antigen ligase n=1 Tax=Methylomusa anaerophila TaxID=1930071 RepID=A0A348AKL7_9FIRM|nr:O-antigen ligase family protein [Methylomusa anaerophila]BBB91615.1 O-Antigen ligase [Methylomusa anaerophila]HML89447.1 O-antigen ligase family protein [Methylomusa anaerophila]
MHTINNDIKPGITGKIDKIQFFLVCIAGLLVSNHQSVQVVNIFYVVGALLLINVVLLTRKIPVIDKTMVIIVGQFFGLILFVNLFSRDVVRSYDYLYDLFLMPALPLFLIPLTITKKEQIMYVLQIMMFPVLILAINTVFEGVYYHHFYWDIVYFTGHHNVKNFGFLAIMLLPFVWAFMQLEEHKQKQRLWEIVLFLFMIGILCSALRALWGFLPVFLLLNAYFEKNKKLIWAASAVTVICIMLIPMLMPNIMTRIMVSDSQDRLAMTYTAIKMGLSSPWVGIGSNIYPTVSNSAEFYSEGMLYFGYAHNIFLMFFAETGIIGLVSIIVLFGGLISYAWIQSTKRHDQIIAAFIIAWISFINYNFTDYIFLNKNETCFMFFVMGLMIAYLNILRQSPSEGVILSKDQQLEEIIT